MPEFTAQFIHLIDVYQVAANADPIKLVLFVALSIPLATLALHFLHRRENEAAFWTVVMFILVELAFRNGDDIQHHVFRVIGLADELQRRNLSELLINDQTGQAFPVFVYYSFVPYIISLALHGMGVPAYAAIKLALALYFLAFCSGLAWLVKTNCRRQSRPQDQNFEFLILLFFICATYVYGIWVKRDALGEVSVYALSPWVVLSLLSEKPLRRLLAIFFFQLALHPAAFGHSLVCEIALACGVSKMPLLEMARRLAGPAAFALMLATPFWLPQILWIHAIMGNAVLPTQYASTFLSLSKLLGLRYEYTVGPWLSVSVILMCLAFRSRLGARPLMLGAVFFLMLAIQTIYLRPIILRVPGLDIFQFIWWLMMPAAFTGLAALLAGLQGRQARAKLPLTLLASLAALNLFVLGLIHTPRYMKTDDYGESSYAAYLRLPNPFGVAAFASDYSRLPRNCVFAKKDIGAISYNALRRGAVTMVPFIAIANAPIAMVTYRAGDSIPATSACGRYLILGPIQPGKTVTIDDTALQDLFDARILSLLGGIALLIAAAAPATFRVSRTKRRSQAEVFES
jgi:hypothetical protein